LGLKVCFAVAVICLSGVAIYRGVEYAVFIEDSTVQMGKPIVLKNLLQSQIAQMKSRSDTVNLKVMDYHEEPNLDALVAKFNEIDYNL